MLLIPEHLTSSDRTAVWNGRWWSYGELVERVRRLAASLRSPRRLAFCFCRTDSGTIVNYLACLEAGHPVALLDGGMAGDARKELVARYRPEIVLATAEETCLEGYARAGDGVWERKSPDGGPLDPDMALMLSTSGTTGSPRFVRLSARNVRSNAEGIIAALGIQESDRAIASLPFHYSYGLSVLNTHLLAGASLVTTMDGLTSTRFWASVREQECTSLAGVPYSYQILHRLDIDKLNVPSLVTMTQAGGKLNPELISRFHETLERRGGRFFVMYGQTEATARMAILPSEDLPRKLGSAGLPLKGGRFRIVDGELEYSGPNVMMGYATCREDLAKGDTLRGVLATGDLCRVDEEGYLLVTGRMKRDAKVFGLRLNLDDVEALLKVHGPTAVVSGSDKLLVYCEYGDAEFLSGLQHQLAARMNINYRAIEFHRLEKLPVHANGKIDYASLGGIG